MLSFDVLAHSSIFYVATEIRYSALIQFNLTRIVLLPIKRFGLNIRSLRVVSQDARKV